MDDCLLASDSKTTRSFLIKVISIDSLDQECVYSVFFNPILNSILKVY